MKRRMYSTRFVLFLAVVLHPSVSTVWAGGPMSMAYGWSTQPDENDAVAEAVQAMSQGLDGKSPKLVVLFSRGSQYNKNKVFTALKTSLDPNVSLWGLNSDRTGVIVPDGIKTGLSVTGFYSPKMVVGVGSAPLDWQEPQTYREAGKQAALAALRDAGKTRAEPPTVVFLAGLNLIACTDIFAGIESVMGDVSILGGNAGQETGDIIPGDGWCLATTAAKTGSISVAALWLNSKIGMSYGYGYTEVPEKHGVVTKADPDKRIIYEIDHRPAADVYNEWTGGKLTDLIRSGGGDVPLSIIGRYCLKKPIAGSTDYVLVAFNGIYPDKSVFVAHEAVPEGTQLSVIEFADEKEVVNKPAVIATIARHSAGIPKRQMAGAMFFQCYAQIYVAREHCYDLSPMVPLLSRTLADAPFTGCLAGGECGYSVSGGNRMIAFSTVMIVFGRY